MERVESRRDEIIASAFNRQVKKHFSHSCQCDFCCKNKQYLIALRDERLAVADYEDRFYDGRMFMSSSMRIANRTQTAQEIKKSKEELRNQALLGITTEQ